jgi:16S rRNA (cytosine967-C5)-methyltransferase
LTSKNTRWLAARVILSVLQEGHLLTFGLDKMLASVASSQDRSFIQAICYGVCRYYHQLDFLVSQLIDKPLKNLEVKVLIMIGLYQLGFLRVKPYAVVSETVSAAKHFAWSKGLINAVLRNYLRRKDSLDQAIAGSITAALSHPDWLIRRIQQDWPEQAESILRENNRQPPMTLRVNAQKATRENYVTLLVEHDIQARLPLYSQMGITLDNPAGIEQLPKFAEGWASVQDGAAQLAVDLLDIRPGQRILDVCAAPGGKTAHILETQPKLAELVAVDIDEKRMQRVKDNLERLGLSANLIVADAAKPEQWWDGNPFDRILLDAPCSATGVIRRHPDIKILRKHEDVTNIVQQQNAILSAIWPLLARQGILVYATCSVLKQENEEQIQMFINEHTDAEELLIDSPGWGKAGKCGRQILPGDADMDGFYYARIVKQ